MTYPIVAPPTGDPWTTVGGQLVAACNGTGGGARAPSANLTFADVSFVNGTGWDLPNGAFTKLPLDTEAADAGNNFNPASGQYIYTVPATGIYMIQALVRVLDGNWTVAGGANLAMGVHTSEIDGAWVQWNKVMPLNSGGGRASFDYTRPAMFTANDQLRLYAYQDSGATRKLYSGAMQIWRIG